MNVHTLPPGYKFWVCFGTHDVSGRADLAKNRRCGEAPSEKWVCSHQSTCSRTSPPATLRKPGVTYSITLSFIRCDSSSPIKSGALNRCFLSAQFIRSVNGRLSLPERFSFLRFLRCLLFHHGWRSKMVVGEAGSYWNVKPAGISLLPPPLLTPTPHPDPAPIKKKKRKKK